MSAYKIGVDIGGTKTNVLFLSLTGERLFEKAFPTDKDPEKIARFVKKETASYPGTPVSVGVGVPGTVDRKEGVVLYAPNLDWRDVPVKKAFQEYFDLPFSLGQDTEAAAVGEYLFGAGKGLSHMVCITVGTGVGCGLIIDGKDHKGNLLAAGEFGHMVAVPDGRVCGCGKKGCVEAYASGTGIRGMYLDALRQGRIRHPLKKEEKEITAKDVFALAKDGDEDCLAILDSASSILANAIVNVINLLSPEAVVLSGGLSVEREYFINPVFTKVRARVYEVVKDKVILTTAKLGASAPAFGAAFFDAISR